MYKWTVILNLWSLPFLGRTWAMKKHGLRSILTRGEIKTHRVINLEVVPLRHYAMFFF